MVSLFCQRLRCLPSAFAPDPIDVYTADHFWCSHAKSRRVQLNGKLEGVVALEVIRLTALPPQR